jgi:hypothetical protein
MSDITYSRRADNVLGSMRAKDDDQLIAGAQINAALAISKAVREVDDKLKYVGKLIADAIPHDDTEKWITWEESDGTRKAVQTRFVMGFSSDGDDAVLFVDGAQQPFRVPISYGTIAMMVGA